MDSSFYNLALELKEKGIEFEYFIQDCIEGGVTDDVDLHWLDDEDYTIHISLEAVGCDKSYTC